MVDSRNAASDKKAIICKDVEKPSEMSEHHGFEDHVVVGFNRVLEGYPGSWKVVGPYQSKRIT